MKTPFPMHWLFGGVSATALAAMLALALSGCDKQAEAPAAAKAPKTSAAAPATPAGLPTPAEEQAAKHEADARRQHFFGDGKSHYTPQDVKGF